jgi:LysM repeat protein
MPVHNVGGPGAAGYGGPSDANQHVATVRVGETTLSDVARRVGVDVHSLSAANHNMDPHQKLKVGQDIRLPDPMATIKKKFEDRSKDLESQDKIGNFEIQELMSDYAKAEELQSNVLKKYEDTASSVAKNIKG